MTHVLTFLSHIWAVFICKQNMQNKAAVDAVVSETQPFEISAFMPIEGVHENSVESVIMHWFRNFFSHVSPIHVCKLLCRWKFLIGRTSQQNVIIWKCESGSKHASLELRTSFFGHWTYILTLKILDWIVHILNTVWPGHVVPHGSCHAFFQRYISRPSRCSRCGSTAALWYRTH